MGQLITENKFLQYYYRKYETYPPSYYHTRKHVSHDFFPTNSHMAIFLSEGNIWESPPWGRITYRIPPEFQAKTLQHLFSLFEKFDYRVSDLHNHQGRITRRKVELFGSTADWRGRPIIEGFIEGEKRVTQVNYTRRKVVEKRKDQKTPLGIIPMSRRKAEVLNN